MMDHQIEEPQRSPPGLYEYQDCDSATSSDYDEEIEEITASEYARSNSLTTDYRLSDPFDLIRKNLVPPELLKYNDAHLFPDQQNLQQLFLERLQIDKEAALLLQEILTPPTASENIRELYASGSSTAVKRLPLPLLRTDNEYDMAYFASRRRNGGPDPRRYFNQFKKLEPFEINDSEEAVLFGRTEHEDLLKEKLQLPREALVFLQEAMQAPAAPNDLPSLLSLQLEHAKDNKVRPITPPLLPREQPPTLPSPNSSAMELDEWSTPSDLTSLELNEMLGQIYQSDHILSPPSGAEHGFDVTTAPSSESIQDVPANQKRKDLKLEVPLLPADSDVRPTKRQKTVCFATTLSEVIPDDFLTGVPAFEPHPSSEEQYQELFAQIINTADEVEATLRNEHLDEFDAIFRPIVPDIARYQPLRPCETLDSEAQSVSSLLSKTLLSSEDWGYTLEGMKWVNVTRLERRLPWNPFPQDLNLDNLADTFEEVQPYLDALTLDTTEDGLVESSSLTYKQPGLRLLDGLNEDEDEDELKPALSSSLIMSASIFGGSKSAGVLTSDATTTLRVPMNSSIRKPLLSNDTRSSSSLKIAVATSHLRDADTEASASVRSDRTDHPGTLLPSFLFTRGKLMESVTDFSTHSYPNTSLSEPSVSVPPPEVEAFSDALEYQRSDDTGTLLESLQPTSLIVATSLYTSQRAMLRMLKAYWPSANLIDRDFSNSDSSLATEADMSLAPSTGLILTTLQKIKQKPLPGQPAQNLLHDRLVALDQKYERLIILISEASSDTVPSRTLDERDANALNDLTVFACELDAEARVIFVPEGSNRLALQVIDCMNACCLDQDHCKVLMEETYWERFLRRAGLNVYAAQVVLRDHLQSPSLIRDHRRQDVQTERSSSPDDLELAKLGLREFLTMTPEDRLARWAEMMGGTRVLRRVNAVLEQNWHHSEAETVSSSVDSITFLQDRHPRAVDIQTSDF